jgi:SAM-dependent methyltransferase
MYDREFHTSIENDEHPQAVRLAEYISKHIPCESFLDFGCSTGLYLREVQERLPAVRTIGYEFSPEAVQNALCPNVCQTDLTQKLETLKTPNTLGLCLEVLEHIDDSQWKPVLENIVTLCDKVIFSAAVPGQGGVGHINCRPKIDWIKRFHELGWVVDLDATNHLLNQMKHGYHMGWFANNAMILIPCGN